ncbi:LADA_0E02168g1_1 [Lachancea dasiensis]|uniref:LADA_0E02168g1_1 n=1 Tax=Lachancea dasiensis TaxID=1072105 RepID=A0A1G4JB00_9SACH|nr:LADA_0E02168g1_1 [Lachancea dasiensis]
MKYPRRLTLEQWDRFSRTTKPPKLITFDAYNTLYSTTLPVMDQYSRIGQKYGLEVSAEELASRFPKVFKDLRQQHPNYGKRTGITAREWWRLLISAVFAPIETPQAMIAEILRVFDGFGAYTVYPDLLELLEHIKEEHPDTILGVASNTDPIMYTLLKNIGLQTYFGNHIYLSYDLELSKPDPKFFDAILQDVVHKNPEILANSNLEDLKASCWHIGDEESNDLTGASAVGWNSVLIDRVDKYKHLSGTADGVTRQVSELYADKIDNHAAKSWETSLRQTDVVQLADREYVVANFNVLKKLLYS